MSDRVAGGSGLGAALARLEQTATAREFVKAVFILMPLILPIHATAFGYRMIGYRPTTVIHSDGKRFTLAGAPSLVFGDPAKMDDPNRGRYSAIRTSDYLPGPPALYGLPFYQEIMKPGGWQYCAGFPLWEDDPGSREMTSFIALVRTAAQGDFSDEEVARVLEVMGVVEGAHRRIVASEVRREVARGLRATVRQLPVAVMVLDAGGVVAMSRLAESFCAEWVGGGSGMDPPAGVGHAAAEVRQGGLGQSREVRGPGELRARVSWLDAGGKDLIRVEFRRDGGAMDRVPEQTLPSEERRLVEMLRTGRKDREIAELTGSSLSQVKSQLRDLFAKHRVRSRAELLARVF